MVKILRKMLTISYTPCVVKYSHLQQIQHLWTLRTIGPDVKLRHAYQYASHTGDKILCVHLEMAPLSGSVVRTVYRINPPIKHWRQKDRGLLDLFVIHETIHACCLQCVDECSKPTAYFMLMIDSTLVAYKLLHVCRCVRE